MMQLGQMRASFIERSGQTADALENSAIDDYLTRAYRFTIPGMLIGELTEEEWSVTIDAGEDVVPLPWYIHSVKNLAWRGNVRVRIYYDYDNFWRDFLPEQTTGGKPNGILAYGRKLTFRFIPDDTYTFKMHTRQYPRGKLTDAAGGTAEEPHLQEIENDNHAQAIVAAALDDFFNDTNQWDKKPQNELEFQKMFSLVRSESLGRPRGHHRIRSF